jgi:hypothetical protein
MFLGGESISKIDCEEFDPLASCIHEMNISCSYFDKISEGNPSMVYNLDYAVAVELIDIFGR